MVEISERLYIGSEAVCRTGNDEWAIVHACKSPCHQQAVGYRCNLSNLHPNYLELETDNDLYLNIIDPDRPLFMPETFSSFLDFAIRHWEQGKKILIHCNRGESRAPSLGLIFLAKYRNEISAESYMQAKAEFENLYPSYRPGLGIQTYLDGNWSEI